MDSSSRDSSPLRDRCQPTTYVLGYGSDEELINLGDAFSAPVYQEPVQAPIPNITFNSTDTHQKRLFQGYEALKKGYPVPTTQLSNASYYLAGAAVTAIGTIAAFIFGQIVLFGLGMGLTVALVFKARELNITSEMDGYNKQYFTLTRLLGEKVNDLTETNTLFSQNTGFVRKSYNPQPSDDESSGEEIKIFVNPNPSNKIPTQPRAEKSSSSSSSE